MEKPSDTTFFKRLVYEARPAPGHSIADGRVDTAGAPILKPIRLKPRDAAVLIVAAEGLVKELLLLFMEARCREVRDAASTVKGLEVFRKRCFDFVMLDAALPAFDRAAFLAEIRKGSPGTAVALFGSKLDGGALDPPEIRADALIGLPLNMDRLFPLFCRAVNARRGLK
jgi:DNA-binding NtrC family response regulator